MPKLIVVSVDSLFTDNLEQVSGLPGFREILKDSRIIKNIHCIYPTLTYPCHATIMSGEYPEKHGVVHNEKLRPDIGNAEWYWHYRDLRVKTIFDYAKESGLTTASVLWPVTGGGPIDYLIPEIWTLLPETDPDEAFLTSISPAANPIYRKNRSLLRWKDNPEYDQFGEECAVDILRRYRPDVLFLHQASLDHARHCYGIYSEEVTEALELHGKWIERLLQTLEETNSLEDTVFIVLGDHGHLPVEANVCPNTLLREVGLLQTDGDGNVAAWEAYSQSCGISAQVFLKNSKNLPAVREIFEDLVRRGFVQRIFEPQELREQYRLDGWFAFMAEAAEGYAFENNAVGELIMPTDRSDYKYSVSTHGHLPERGQKPCFIIHGKGIRAGEIDGAELIDEAPTMLDILGIPHGFLPGKSLL